MTDASLPEISEVDAEGATAELYARIRSQSGSALVNYVWRHLATIPGGAAEWCWDVATANETASAERAIGIAADRDALMLACAGGPEVSPGPVTVRLIRAYNRNNPGNLARVRLLLEALRLLHDGEVTQDSGSPPQVQSVAPVRDSGLPPLPAVGDLSAADRTAAEWLARVGPGADSGVDPSLWRHLSVEPGLLPNLAPDLAAVIGSDEFAEAHARLCRPVQPSHPAQVPDRAVEFDAAAVAQSLRAFATRIAELTLAGRIVARWCNA